MSIDGILTTTGVNSQVLDKSDNTVGHITLCDYDDTCGADYDLMLEDVINLQGITAILKSSKQSYHVWNLSIRSKTEVLETKAGLHDDSKHLCIGYRRGRWALRLSGKYEPNGDVYKSAPQLQRVICNKSDMPQSKPHVNLLLALADRQDVDIDIDKDRYDLQGQAAPTEQYMTVVDDLKTFGESEDG